MIHIWDYMGNLRDCVGAENCIRIVNLTYKINYLRPSSFSMCNFKYMNKIAMEWSIKSFLLLLTAILTIGCNDKNEPILDNQQRKIEVLFLGHDSEHHNSEAYLPILATALADDAINFTYTDELSDLNPEYLSKFDALMIYANHDSITASQEQALLDYVETGHGLLAIHSASYCFRNSEAYVNLVGAQFQKHGTGTFTAQIINHKHPITKDLEEFKTWDETYVHTKHNTENRTILMKRKEEPWTWVRTYGDGRVFYTAYGHDKRTWTKDGFQKLLRNAIIWSVDEQVRAGWKKFVETMPELTIVERPNIPNYEERASPPEYQFPLSPKASQKLAQIPPGFELKLFASEPMIVKPIEMNWDRKGRLWIIEASDYPNRLLKKRKIGHDKIKILEDTDNDGRADKVTVFADSLNLATSLVFVNGGVLVAQAPHFLFLKDTNGDDKADVRKKIMSGWGTFDTHAGPSHLQYGFDNRIWGSVGYSGFKGVIGGDSVQFSQGFYSFSTDFDHLDFKYITSTSNNTWGLTFNATFDVFGSTANNAHVVYMGIPRQYFKNYEGDGERLSSVNISGHYAMHPIRVIRQVDVFGGFTAAAGLEFYTARQFPKKYWNRIAFVSAPTGGLVHRAIIEPEGAGYIEKDGWNIFASHDAWTAPIQAKVGPDGALWIADWYNFIVQHNPTPTESFGGYDAKTGEGNAYINSLRDHVRGRIYRLVYTGSKQHKSDSKDDEPVVLSKKDPMELVRALTNDNMFWRLTAQRLLVERGKTDVLQELFELVKNTEADQLGLNTAAQHALWTIHGLGALDGTNQKALNVAIGALDNPAAGVRKAAIKVLPGNKQANQALLKSGVLHDPDAHVQLAAILATVEMPPSDKIAQILLELRQQEKIKEDPWLSQALKLAMDAHKVDAKKADVDDTPKKERPPKTTKDIKVIQLKAVVNKLKYNLSEFKVKAGEKVKIVFKNPTLMKHNVVIVESGSIQKVGNAAVSTASQSNATGKKYVPDMPEVLFATKLVDPQESVTLIFTAPEEPGKYPYICTFPGHWRSMQGTMTVIENN